MIESGRPWFFDYEDAKRGLLSLQETSLSTLGLDPDLATFSLPSNVTISTFIAALLDDESATAARSTLGATKWLTEYVIPVSYSLTATELEGCIINNCGQTDDITYWLPVAAPGLHAYFVCGTGVSKTLSLKADSSNKFYANGVASNYGEALVTTPVIGNVLHLMSFKVDSTWEWLAIALIGIWNTSGISSTRMTTSGDIRITTTGDTRVISM